MSGISFQFGGAGLGAPEPQDRRIEGVCPAMVMSNTDLLTEGRIQIQVPWLPGYFLWARVAVPMAGMARGTFFIPQVGDEVLVAFAQGDVREAYVIGSLWSTTDKPPALTTVDPTTKRIIRTPLGHEIEFDEAEGTITITNMTKHTITLSPDGIEISTVGGLASISLSADGSIELSATQSISLSALDVDIDGELSSTLSGGASVTIDGGADCSISGGTVNIN